MKNKKVLITSGPTSVPIDEMRVISNRSTGELGRLIANACARQGARVTLLEGAVTTTMPLAKGIRVRKFIFFHELDQLLRGELKKRPDLVIHAAAVSDFELAKPFADKIRSGRSLTLKLKPTTKIITLIKKQAPRVLLVGFKLEMRIDKKFIMNKVRSLFREAGCDLVVANRAQNRRYEACLVSPSGQISFHMKDKKNLVKALLGKVDEMLSPRSSGLL